MELIMKIINSILYIQQILWLICVGINTYHGHIQKGIYGLLWTLVIEFVIKYKIVKE